MRFLPGKRRAERTDRGDLTVTPHVALGAHVLAPFETPLGVRTLEGYVVQIVEDGRLLIGADVSWPVLGDRSGVLVHRDTIWSWAHRHEVRPL